MNSWNRCRLGLVLPFALLALSACGGGKRSAANVQEAHATTQGLPQISKSLDIFFMTDGLSDADLTPEEQLAIINTRFLPDSENPALFYVFPYVSLDSSREISWIFQDSAAMERHEAAARLMEPAEAQHDRCQAEALENAMQGLPVPDCEQRSQAAKTQLVREHPDFGSRLTETAPFLSFVKLFFQLGQNKNVLGNLPVNADMGPDEKVLRKLISVKRRSQPDFDIRVMNPNTMITVSSLSELPGPGNSLCFPYCGIRGSVQTSGGTVRFDMPMRTIHQMRAGSDLNPGRTFLVPAGFSATFTFEEGSMVAPLPNGGLCHRVKEVTKEKVLFESCDFTR